MDQTEADILAKLTSPELFKVWPRNNAPETFNTVSRYVANTRVTYWVDAAWDSVESSDDEMADEEQEHEGASEMEDEPIEPQTQHRNEGVSIQFLRQIKKHRISTS